MKIFAVFCYVFAAVDFAGVIFEYDITGVFWTPLAAIGLGSILMNIANKKKKVEAPEEQEDVIE